MPQPEKTIEYTVVNHRVQKKLGLTTNEYCIANSIYILATNPKNPFEGWCGAKKEILATFIGVTTRTVSDILKSLELKGIVVIMPDSNRRFCKTSDLWNEEFYPIETRSEESSDGQKKVPTRSEESSDLEGVYINNINNNNYNNILSPIGDSGDPPEKVVSPARVYGNPDVNLLMAKGLEILQIDCYDGTVKQNRKDATIALNKFKNTRIILAILSASKQSDFWDGKITCYADVLKHGQKIINSVKTRRSSGGIGYAG